jgi:hypothetical protein
VISDGRLDLDDAGRVVDDAVGPTSDVVDGGLDGGRTDLFVSWVRAHPVIATAAAAAAVAALAAGGVLTLRPGPVAPLSSVSVTPVPVAQVLAVRDRVGRVGVVTIAYDVAPAPHGSTFSVRGVEGAAIRASSARVVTTSRTGQRVLVTAVPDCTDAHSFDGVATDYHLLVTRTDPDGRSATGAADAPGTVLADEVRRTCWARLGSTALASTVIATRVDQHLRQLVLSVRMTNTSGRAVRLSAVDIADVSTIDPADSAVIQDGSSAVLHVRLPAAVCLERRAGSRRPGASLNWAVGAPDGDVAAVVSVAVPAMSRRLVSAGLDELCGPTPLVRAEVVAATELPPSPLVAFPDAVTLRLRVSFQTDARSLLAGDDPSVLTADARPVFTAEASDVGPAGAVVDVVWSARCGATTAPRLPLVLTRAGQQFHTSVVLGDPLLAQAFSAVCHTEVTEIVARWSASSERGVGSAERRATE